MNKTMAGFFVFLGAAVVICFGAVDYAGKYQYGGIRGDIGFGNAKLSNMQEFAADEIRNINMEYKSQNVYFYKGSGDKVVIKEYLTDGRESEISVRGNTLSVMGTDGGIRFLHFRTEKVEVFLPENYHGSIKVAAASGNIHAMDTLELEKFAVAVKSGNISCDAVMAAEIAASADSGNIVFQKAQGKRRIMTASGNISLRAGEGDTEVSSKSGNISVVGAAGDFIASASSGNVKAEFIRTGGEISVETSSGNIRIELPKDSSFRYDGKASSGTIRTDFDDRLAFNDRKNEAKGNYGNGTDARIRTMASSGSIRILLK